MENDPAGPERPRLSFGSAIQAAILACMLLTMAAGGFAFFLALRSDVDVLQSQMRDVKSWVVYSNANIEKMAAAVERLAPQSPRH